MTEGFGITLAFFCLTTFLDFIFRVECQKSFLFYSVHLVFDFFLNKWNGRNSKKKRLDEKYITATLSFMSPSYWEPSTALWKMCSELKRALEERAFLETSSVCDILYRANNQSEVSKCGLCECRHQHLLTCCTCTVPPGSELDVLAGLRPFQLSA